MAVSTRPSSGSSATTTSSASEKAAGEPCALAHEHHGGRGEAARRDQHPLHRAHGLLRVEVAQLLLRHLGQLVQREGAQGGQVPRGEEAAERGVDPCRGVDVAARDALAECPRREVDEPDLIGLVEEAVGEGLAYVNAGERESAGWCRLIRGAGR